MLAPVPLDVRGVRPTDIGAFLPSNPQPAQVFDHGLGEIEARPLRIQVLIAEHKNAIVLSRAPVRGPEGASVAQVQQSRWRWRDTAAIWLRSSTVSHVCYFTPLG